MKALLRTWFLVLISTLVPGSRAVVAQGAGGTQPTAGYGSLTQEDLALHIRAPDIDVRFVPLDVRVTRLLARDSYESLRSLCNLGARASIRWITWRACLGRGSRW
jgi:hypothetical protein